jgi:hypothetical protein
MTLGSVLKEVYGLDKDQRMEALGHENRFTCLDENFCTLLLQNRGCESKAIFMVAFFFYYYCFCCCRNTQLFVFIFFSITIPICFDVRLSRPLHYDAVGVIEDGLEDDDFEVPVSEQNDTGERTDAKSATASTLPTTANATAAPTTHFPPSSKAIATITVATIDAKPVSWVLEVTQTPGPKTPVNVIIGTAAFIATDSLIFIHLNSGTDEEKYVTSTIHHNISLVNHLYYIKYI